MVNSNLQTQISILRHQLEADLSTISQKCNLDQIDLKNPKLVFEAINNALLNTEFHPYFVTILGHLCIIITTKSAEYHAEFWESLESFILDKMKGKSVPEDQGINSI